MQGWGHALDEVSFLMRIARGEPLSGEGHRPEDKTLCLGIVPWAPVPAGPEILERYIVLAKERTGSDEVWKKVRGVRYLVQDKPKGTMLTEGFLEGLKWLGNKGLVFDLGVDARSGGFWQLREAVEMMKRVYGEGDYNAENAVVFIISTFSPFLRLFVSAACSEFKLVFQELTLLEQITSANLISGSHIPLPNP